MGGKLKVVLSPPGLRQRLTGGSMRMPPCNPQRHRPRVNWPPLAPWKTTMTALSRNSTWILFAASLVLAISLGVRHGFGLFLP
ncbi:TPA: hypothetical protein ACQJWO_005942, partial [Klebsiella pneumoniae]